VVKRIFGPKRVVVAGGWRRLHNEELRNLCASPNVVREIKSRRMRWAGHVSSMGEMTSAYEIFVEKLNERDAWKTVVDARIILKWILKKYCGKLWAEFVWFRTGNNCGPF
jgi:hypothetical protein